MVPERLGYLSRLDKFYKMLTEEAKQDNITETDFYLILALKCKSLNKERIRRKI